jgi:TRAP-type C4-dicarboxylate transport system permease small subunit
MISLVGLRLSEVAVLLLLVITAYAVVGRYFFNSPSIHAVEVSKYLMVFMVWAAAAWTYRIDRHVGFETVKYVQNPALKRVFTLIAKLAVFLFCLTILYSGILSTLTAYDKDYRTASLLDFPLWVILACIPVGVFMLGLEALNKPLVPPLPAVEEKPSLKVSSDG